MKALGRFLFLCLIGTFAAIVFAIFGALLLADGICKGILAALRPKQARPYKPIPMPPVLKAAQDAYAKRRR